MPKIDMIADDQSRIVKDASTSHPEMSKDIYVVANINSGVAGHIGQEP